MPASCRRATVARNSSSGSVTLIGGEEAKRVVAPVVDQPARRQKRLVDECVDRKQLERRHAEPPEMIHHRRRGERRETYRATPAALIAQAASIP